MSEVGYIAERAEIERIDFLLNELARAVERGEVPRASYDLMAPRHLMRRARLVEAITGVAQPSGEPAVPVPVTVPVRRAKPVAKPVDWTTVLLFLGAFLVIVASAIFSVVAWGVLGTGAKFGFMAALTVGFYLAGWWARTRLKLVVGSTALTVVASSMLLFDGWILIDGYQLSGPWPWAALLLVCSLAYWYTETRISSGFFGVIGAGAQISWWWLLGAGLEFSEPVRIAGIALVALGWQIASERGKGRAGVGSLAAVLAWAAPVFSAGAAVAIFADIARVGTAVPLTVASAAVVSACGGVVLWRALSREATARSVAAAAVQVPLFAACVAAASVGDVWWIVAVLAGAAAVYAWMGLSGAGVAFLIAGLLAEAGAVLEACLVLDVPAATTLVVLAGLAALWSLAARLLASPRGETLGLSCVREAVPTCDVASFVLLVTASVALSVVTLAQPVPFFDITSAEALAYVGVLVAWWAVETIRPSAVGAFALSLFSFAALAAVEVWAWPAPSAGLFALPLVALSAVWLASGRVLVPRYGDVWGVITRVCARLALAGLVFVPLLLPAYEAERVGPWGAMWDPVTLVALAALVMLADAVAASSRASSVMAGPLAVAAAWLAGDALVGSSGGWIDNEFVPLAAAVAGLLVAGVAFAGRRGRIASVASWIALPATIVASAVILDGFSRDGGWPLALAAILVAGAWCLSAMLATQWLAGGAGVSLIVALLALPVIDAGAWVSVAAFGLLGLSLGAMSLTSGFGRDGAFAHAGAALAVAGTLALAVGAAVLDEGGQSQVVAMLLLGAGTALSAAVRRFEPGAYIAGFAFVVAAWLEISIIGENSAPAALYALPLAVYVAGAGYVHVRCGAGRSYPKILDPFAVLVGVGYPLLIALQSAPDRALTDSIAAVVMALIAIGAGIALKVRWYLYGGAAGLALIALYRSFSAIAEYWWLVLGLVGVVMLGIALTWQRQRIVVDGARESLRRSFEGWRDV